MTEEEFQKIRGRPKKPRFYVVPGKDCTNRKGIDDNEETENKMLLGLATEEELKWFKQKIYEMKRDRAIKIRTTKESRISQREKNFWEKYHNEEKQKQQG